MDLDQSPNNADCGLLAFNERDFYEDFADMLIVGHQKYWHKRGFRFNLFKRRRDLLYALCMRGYEKGYFSIAKVNYYLMADEFHIHHSITPWKGQYDLPWLSPKPEEYIEEIGYWNKNLDFELQEHENWKLATIFFAFLIALYYFLE